MGKAMNTEEEEEEEGLESGSTEEDFEGLDFEYLWEGGEEGRERER